jgi:hypothetical protein
LVNTTRQFPQRIIRGERSPVLVILSGLATTALALLGVYILDVTSDDFHIMGWYANYVLPAGAIIVGVVASSGYGLASWFTGIKITRKLLWTVLALQTIAYFAAQYIEFKQLHLVHPEGHEVGFLEYFDAVARSFAWKQDDGSPGQPLGMWGYFFRGLEIVGFAAGGLIVPAVLRKTPYCEPCQRYMRAKLLCLIPASLPLKQFKKRDAEGKANHQAEQNQAFERGKGLLESLRQAAVANKRPEFQTALTELGARRKATGKLPLRISVSLVRCLGCHAGKFNVALLAGQGNKIQRTDLGPTVLEPDFVRAITRESRD